MNATRKSRRNPAYAELARAAGAAHEIRLVALRELESRFSLAMAEIESRSRAALEQFPVAARTERAAVHMAFAPEFCALRKAASSERDAIIARYARAYAEADAAYEVALAQLENVA